jgi:hypothetical protein
MQRPNGRRESLLSDVVERRGSLIKNQNGRLPVERARNGDALPLSSGELCASLSHRRIQPVRQPGEKLVELRGSSRFGDAALVDLRVLQPPALCSGESCRR